MASVTLFNSMDRNVLPSGVMETPKIHLEVPIMCAYEKSMIISADFGSMGYRLFVASLFLYTVSIMRFRNKYCSCCCDSRNRERAFGKVSLSC